MPAYIAASDIWLNLDVTYLIHLLPAPTAAEAAGDRSVSHSTRVGEITVTCVVWVALLYCKPEARARVTYRCEKHHAGRKFGRRISYGCRLILYLSSSSSGALTAPASASGAAVLISCDQRSARQPPCKTTYCSITAHVRQRHLIAGGPMVMCSCWFYSVSYEFAIDTCKPHRSRTMTSYSCDQASRLSRWRGKFKDG